MVWYNWAQLSKSFIKTPLCRCWSITMKQSTDQVDGWMMAHDANPHVCSIPKIPHLFAILAYCMSHVKLLLPQEIIKIAPKYLPH